MGPRRVRPAVASGSASSESDIDIDDGESITSGIESVPSDGDGSDALSDEALEDSDDVFADDAGMPQRLTSRQRAMLGDNSGAEDAPAVRTRPVAAPAPSDTDAVLKEEKKRRRADQRDARMEQTRTDTIRKLLEKQSTRGAKRRGEAGDEDAGDAPKSGWYSAEVEPDRVRTVTTCDGCTFAIGSTAAARVPTEMVPVAAPRQQTCAATGCKRPRACLHVPSNAPFCGSLSCHRKMSAI